MKKGYKFSQSVLIMAAIIVTVILVLPIYVMLVTSIKPETELFNLSLLPNIKTMTVQSFKDVFVTQNLENNIKNSAFVAIVTTCLSLFIHSMAGYSFARLRFPLKKQLFLWVLSSMMIPFSVIMIPLFIITRTLHLTNSLWGIIIPLAPNAYGVFLLRQFFLGIPKELEESARIDGTSLFMIYWRIILPLSLPILMTLGISYFIWNWNNFLWPLIVSNKKEQWLIQIAIVNFKGDRKVLWNEIFAASVIASLPVFFIFSYFQRYLVDGIKMSGLKT